MIVKNKEYWDKVYEIYIDPIDVLDMLGVKVIKGRFHGPESRNLTDRHFQYNELKCYSYKNNNSYDATQLYYYYTTGEEEPVRGKKYMEVKEEVLDKLHMGVDISDEILYVKPKRKYVEDNHSHILSNKKLDKAYRSMIQYIHSTKNNSGYVEELMRRGVKKEDITIAHNEGFAMTPTQIMSNDIVQHVQNQTSLGIGVPGFYKDDNDKLVIKHYYNMPGMLIPRKSYEGYLRGFEVRNISKTSNDGAKYFSFSSSGEKEGTSPGGISAFFKGNDGYDNIAIITEGSLKAFMISYFLKTNVFAVPGVQIQKDLLEQLKIAKEKGLKGVYIAYDMDWQDNENVLKGLKELAVNLKELDIPFKVLSWDDNFKGFDDFLKALDDNNQLDAFKEVYHQNKMMFSDSILLNTYEYPEIN